MLQCDGHFHDSPCIVNMSAETGSCGMLLSGRTFPLPSLVFRLGLKVAAEAASKFNFYCQHHFETGSYLAVSVPWLVAVIIRELSVCCTFAICSLQ